MAPRASNVEVYKPGGPKEIRTLASATTTFLDMLHQMTETIQTGVESGTWREEESSYIRLLLSISAAERDLRWISERCNIVLGLETDKCPTCGSSSKVLTPDSPCLSRWHHQES